MTPKFEMCKEKHSGLEVQAARWTCFQDQAGLNAYHSEQKKHTCSGNCIFLCEFSDVALFKGFLCAHGFLLSGNIFYLTSVVHFNPTLMAESNKFFPINGEENHCPPNNAP